jgi:hypothetical protein
MPDLAVDYKIPAELTTFIDDGFLEFLSENAAEKTIKFNIPLIAWIDEHGHDIMFTLVWIHPDFNAQFCHYFLETPGDLANFYVFKETSGMGDEQLDIESLDDLLCWLQVKQEERQ